MVIRFGDFELDQGRFELRKRGEVVPVQRRVLETIFYLAMRAGRLVTREELANGPWAGTVVGDAAIARAIKEARAALGDTGEAPRTIATVRGVGFRFDAQVEEVRSNEVAPPVVAHPGARAFAGRERELADLELAWSEACGGDGNLVLVAGGPGIGKSTLVEHFCERVSLRDGEVHWGRCLEAQGTPPHWPWPELLRSYAERHGSLRLKSLAQGDLAEIASVAPALSRRIVVPPSEIAEGPYSAFRALDAVARFFRRAAEQNPLALVLEDIHLADGAALDLLEHLQRSLAESRLLIVATCRSLEARERRQLRALLEGTLPHGRTLELGGLTKGDVSRWFEHAGGAADALELTERVTRTTDGHPLLIANLIRALPSGFGAAELEQALARELCIPENLSASIRKQIECFEPDVIELLRTASVLGEEVWLPVLAELRQCPPSELGPPLDRALRGGILERRESGRLRFTHALVRDHLYGELDSARRLELHVAAAAAFSRRFDDHPELVVEAAHHAMAASPMVKVEETVELLVKAADWARKRLAFGLAAEHLQWALQVVDLGGPAPRRRAELLLLFAQSLHLAGRVEEAVRAYHELYEIGDANDDGEHMALALLGDHEIRQEAATVDSLFHAKLGRVMSRPWQPNFLFARLRAVQAVTTPFSEPEHIRMEWFAEASRIVSAAGEPSARMGILQAASRMEFLNRFTEPERLLPLPDELVVLARRLGAADTLVQATIWRASFQLTLGRGAEFLADVADIQAVSSRLRQPQWQYFPRLMESSRSLLGGNLVAAERLAREAVAVGAASVGILVHSLLTVQLLAIGLEADGAKRTLLLNEALESGRVVTRHVPGFEVMATMIATLETKLGISEAGEAILRTWSAQWAAQTFKNDSHTLLRLALLSNVAASRTRRGCDSPPSSTGAPRAIARRWFFCRKLRRPGRALAG